jgi:hypothetical protein
VAGLSIVADPRQQLRRDESSAEQRQRETQRVEDMQEIFNGGLTSRNGMLPAAAGAAEV